MSSPAQKVSVARAPGGSPAALIEECFPAFAGWAAVSEGDQTPCVHPDEINGLPLRAAEKRRREFTLGRTAARQALRNLGASAGPVLRGDRGQPWWPEGVVGSITHAGGMAVAAVAPSGRTAGIGIDLEVVRPNGESEFLNRICGREEREWVDEGDTASTVRLTLVFSAKESLFKALFPLTGLPLDFEDATLEPIPGRSSFLAHLNRDLRVPWRGKETLEVGYRIGEAMVFTFVVLPSPEKAATYPIDFTREVFR